MRRISFGTIVLLGAALLGCGGKGPDSGPMVPPPPPPTATFKCSDSPPQPDQIVMRCGIRLKPDVWQVDVVIGAHAASDIGGFAFELVFDTTKLTYVPGSAQTTGTMLSQDGVTTLLGVNNAPGDPGRLVVGIYRIGGAPGVAVVPGMFDRVMVFKVKAVPGVQFDGDPGHLMFDKTRSEALDPADPPQPLPSIAFSNALLLSFE